ncbi:putative transcriptional regulatory protein [Pseudoalteromonas luteoviolacea B = ATCC 29581]|nr:putative transcriptional regulatory protein [Pseudoalteromonas luteoviolacea B = ATCC 29581]
MLIQLGDFELNTVEMTLDGQNAKVILEPKVFEVLCYLIENSERYVSMGELHENVWHGRCVSDAAVRRIISKIRAILNDDHKEPKYLQSLSKRGYRLICVIERISEPEANDFKLHAEVNENINLIAGGKLDENSFIETVQEPLFFSNPNFSFISKLILTAISVILLVILYFAFEPKRASIEDNGLIDTFGGQKRAFSWSQDGRYLAYFVKLKGEKGFQIVLKDNKSGESRLLSKQEHNPLTLAFSSDAKYLFYTDLSSDSAHLYQINLESNETQAIQLMGEFDAVYKVFTSFNHNEIYFTGYKKATSTALIYQLSIDSQVVRQITHSSYKDVYDTKLDFSPNSKLMAILRVTEENTRNTINVLDTVTQSPRFEYLAGSTVFDVDWLDDEHLLLLSGSDILKVNVVSGKEQKISLDGNEFVQLQVRGNNTFTALHTESVPYSFIEKRLPLADFSSIKVIESEENMTSLNYQSKNQAMWAVIKNEENYELVLLNKENDKETKTYLSSIKKIRYIDDSADNKHVLLFIDNRLAALNKESYEISYITAFGEPVGDVDLSKQNQDVFYTVKRSGEWQLHRFDLETRQSSLILTHFRYVRQHSDNFVVGSEERELFYYDVKSHSFSALNVTLSENYNTNWGVVNSYIYWSTHDLKTTTIHELNIANIEQPVLTQLSFDYAGNSPWFYLNKYRNSLTMKVQNNQRSQLKNYQIH